MNRYVALLRGINVGGKNLIKMTDLKACFEDNGFHDVTTFIQSGNVVFGGDGTAAVIVQKVETMLSATFKYSARIVLRSRTQMRATVARAPKGFGSQPNEYRYDVLFVKEPLRAAAVIKGVPTREGVDEAAAGPGAVYFSRLVSRATQSQLNRLVSMPIYQNLTIRNWNTTTKLCKLMETPA